jgi:TPR repeat protein
LILAELYRDGTGTRRNPAEAVVWMTKSANQGYRPAQLALGEALRDGKGTARDPVEALKWFLLAAGMTKLDASAGCTRLVMESSVTRQRAREAVKALQDDLSPSEADRAQLDANNWVAAFKAKPVGGC